MRGEALVQRGHLFHVSGDEYQLRVRAWRDVTFCFMHTLSSARLRLCRTLACSFSATSVFVACDTTNSKCTRTLLAHPCRGLRLAFSRASGLNPVCLCHAHLAIGIG